MSTATRIRSTIEADARKARAVFPKGYIVDKSIAAEQVFGPLPRFVKEYLIGTTVEPGKEREGLAKVREMLRGRIYDASQQQLVKARLMEEGRYKLIDHVEVQTDLKSRRYTARINVLDDKLLIDDEVVRKHEKLLLGGVWGVVEIVYDPDAKDDYERLRIVGFEPFQLTRPNLEVFREARSRFTTDEWMRLLLRSAGYEPDVLHDPRRWWLLLARLVPLVQNHVNLVELGPRGTGKSYLLRNLSPQVRLLSGGRASTATLFVDGRSRQIGLVGTRKVIVFDEIASTTFPDDAVVAALKDYMASGQFALFNRHATSDASLVFAGNLDVDDDKPRSDYIHLFQELPPKLIDSALLDRVHAYLPGWEMPKIRDAGLTRGVGFVTDYFGEVLLALRASPDTVFDEIIFEGDPTKRDTDAIRRVASGLFKLVFPDDRATYDERQTCVRLATEFRQRVNNQLAKIAPGEFKAQVSFVGMKPFSDIPDFRDETELSRRDEEVNTRPRAGLATALTVVMMNGVAIGGDVAFIETGATRGTGRLSITGRRGTTMTQSLSAARKVVERLNGKWQNAAKLVKSRDLHVHLVNIAEAKDGPSAGVTFVAAMISALLDRPLRPGVAMTGEVSLLGRVDPVGGVATKILAAHAHGRTRVIIPKANERDLERVDPRVRGAIEVCPVETIEEALELAIE